MEAFRVVVLSTVPPVAEHLVPTLRELGHETVAVVSARTARDPHAAPPELQPGRTFDVVSRDVALHFPATKHQLAPIFRLHEPDVVLCWGYPWKVPTDALAVPRLGAVNHHPGLLPRHRGPMPLAWALRDGDPAFGLTWHRMDADLDTGPILAQETLPIEDDDCGIEDVAPRLLATAFGMLPRVLERVAARDPGDAQPDDGVSWAPRFEEDYVVVDWSQPARSIHDQVRAWAFTFGLSGMVAPIAELDGRRVRLLRTSLTEKPGAERVEAGDGPLWVVAAEPVDGDAAGLGGPPAAQARS